LATCTIKNLRTAILECTALVEGKRFSQLPEVKAFINGLERKKPVPRKDLRAKWEIADLVRYLQAMPPWKELSLMQEGQKMRALLCIATGWRPASDFARTLASVDFEFAAGPEWPTSLGLTAIDVKEGGDKQSKVIPRLLEDQSLCPALATFRYLQDSKQIRPANAIFLFVAANPPHANLTADRLRNWLKAHMLAAGIPVQFTPHSIRAVTTPAAFEAGTLLEAILT
jgi:integrase